VQFLRNLARIISDEEPFDVEDVDPFLEPDAPTPPPSSILG
jgi:hypothetical protein